MTDDRAVEDRAIELQRSGREVSISTTNPETDIRKVPSIGSIVSSLADRYSHDPNLWW